MFKTLQHFNKFSTQLQLCKTYFIKHPRKDLCLLDSLKKLSRDLIKKIFEDYLQISLINEILKTPTTILRTSAYIHHALLAYLVPRKATIDKRAISSFIFTHIGHRSPIFIHFAKVNEKVISSLKVNDTFDYYEPHRNGRYIVLKVFKRRAIVQKIKYQNTNILYKGLLIQTVTKVSQRKSLCFKILNERCVFSSLRNVNVCFLNNMNVPISVSYFIDDVNISEKRSAMSEYSLI